MKLALKKLALKKSAATGVWPAAVIATASSAYLYFKLKREAHKRKDQKVDHMVDQSFPASDAPAY